MHSEIRINHSNHSKWLYKGHAEFGIIKELKIENKIKDVNLNFKTLY